MSNYPKESSYLSKLISGVGSNRGSPMKRRSTHQQFSINDSPFKHMRKASPQRKSPKFETSKDIEKVDATNEVFNN